MRTPHRAASALTGSLLLLGLLAGCGDDDGGAAADGPTTPASETSSAASEPSQTATGQAEQTEEPSPTSTATSGQEGVVPVYYVGDTPAGDRLYREFNRVSGIDLLVAAAAGVTQGDAVDPDYRTLWPGGRFAAVTQEADAIVVEVPDRSWLQPGKLDKARARLAVQQLVYTLQGAAGKRLPVEVEYAGRPAATLLGVDASKGLRARPELDVLALVNVTEPAEGTVVPDRFVAQGRASSFEGTVVWEIRDGSDKVVMEGWANAAGWDRLHPWKKTINVAKLAPGSYTFLARTDDPSAGEGPGPTEDTKRITVK